MKRTMRDRRWFVGEFFEDDAHLLLTVITARGTGRRAYGSVVVTPEVLDDRRMRAWAIRQARNAAMEYRLSKGKK